MRIEIILIILAIEVADSAFNATRDVKFWLFTQSNPTTGQNISANALSLASSSFNPVNPTRIFIHGWNNNYTAFVPTEIKNAYLKKGNFNMILVDWGVLATNMDYAIVQANCSSVADEIAKLLRFLVTNNSTDLSKLVISGHSLGAHIAGFVGKQVRNISAIVGLDPAGPGYSANAPNTRLNSTDAKIVQVIHTTSTAGAWYSIGTADFFMNNCGFFAGLVQPGCGFDFTCSHGRSADYFAESINSFGFRVSETYMGGEPLAANATENYNLNTNAQSPYAKG